MRFPLLACLLLALPAAASAGSIGIVRTDASRCFTADSDPAHAFTPTNQPTGVAYSTSNGACREIGTTVDDNVFAQTAFSAGGAGTGSAQATFGFDAAIDADGAVIGSSEYQHGHS